MKCEHKGCKEEAEINICHNHINKDYPTDFSQVFNDIDKACEEWDMGFNVSDWFRKLKKKYINSETSHNSQKNQSAKEEIRKLQVPLSDKSIRELKKLRKRIAD